MKIEERIEVAQKVEGTRANCIGAALYLTGCVSEEKYMEPTDGGDLFVENMPLLNAPVQHCLVVYRDQYKEVVHMGVLTDVATLQLIHRSGPGSPLTSSCISQVQEEEYPSCTVEFRDPTLLSQAGSE